MIVISNRKNVLTTIIVFLITITSFGQSPNWDWAKSSGGNNSDQGISIANDQSGNSYVTGVFASSTIKFNTTLLANHFSGGFHHFDIFIAKYDNSGNVLWAKSAGGTFDDWAYSITTDISGNVYVAGYFVQSITFDSITLYGGFRDVFLVKYDTNGNLLWAKSSGGSSADEAHSVTVDVTGNIYLTGFFESSSITFGTTTLTNTTSNSSDIFITKYDSGGNVLWAKKAGGNNYDYATSVCGDIFNNVYVTGYFYSSTITFSTTTLPNTSSYNMFIAKYDNTGNLLWVKSPGGAYPQSICSNTFGEIIQTGAFASSPIIFGSDTLTSKGNYDMFLTKYDTNGNVIWAKSGGGTASDQGNAVAIDSNNNIYMVGFYQSPYISFFTDTLINNNPLNNFFIVSYNNNGGIQWTKNADSNSNFVTANSISSYSNEIHITGTFNNDSITFGTTLLLNDTTDTSSDMYVAKLKTQTTTGISENTEYIINSFCVFPNPTSGQITISNSKKYDKVIITDLLGQIVYQAKDINSTTSLRIDKTGIYLVTLISNKQTFTKKIIVQN